ncbi:MAG: hypothetical protein R2727_12245 [Bacteroidales bacterium]
MHRWMARWLTDPFSSGVIMGSPMMTMHPDGSVGMSTNVTCSEIINEITVAATLDARVNWLRLEKFR